MNITINQQELIHTLELISRVSTKHVTLPVLQCVLIHVSDSEVTFTATNLEISIEARVNATIMSAGSVAVSAVTLLQSVQYISKKDVVLRVEDGVMIVESGSGVTKINTMPHEEFPKITKLIGEGSTIKRQTFALGIKTVAFAASVSSIKPELGSIYIQQKKEHSLTFVATDSFRLMEKTVPQQGFILPQTLLIPQKNAAELARICDLLPSDPKLVINDNQCALEFTEGVYITSRLVAGSFPDYEQIIPKEYVTHTTVLKQDLVQLFKKTQIFLNKFMQVTLAVSPEGLTMSSQNGEVGATTDTVKASTEGSPLTLNFNQQYVLDPLSHISDDSIVLHFAGIGRPLVIQGITDASLRYLVMPMNK
jgi:DNA polymerase III subunit beta